VCKYGIRTSPEKLVLLTTTIYPPNLQNRKPQLVAESNSIKSMDALIKILVDNMQLLQTKVLDMEKAKQRTNENVGQQRQRPREIRTCCNCNQQSHFY
jgi:hypothetical protein